MNKKSVLFVDDESKLLEGLRRMLRGMRNEWDMVFVPGGREALEHLEGHPVDVVVSDMRMPGMDGVELLSRVKAGYPNTVRIALSGYSEQEMTIKSVGPAHQFLAKPCDPDKLIDTIKRAVALRDHLVNRNLVGLVSNIQSLPSLPDLYSRVLREINSPDGSVKKAGEIIAQDVGMSAKVLQLVNSAFFGLPQHVSSPAQAVGLLGLETIRALVLSVHIFSKYQGERMAFFPLDDLLQHSLSTGSLARTIAQDRGLSKNSIDNAFLAGLLHDVGKLILAANLSREYQEVMERARETQTPIDVREKERFGASHAGVGAYLLGLWGLPDEIVEAAAFHHYPERCVGRDFGVLTAVYTANKLINETRSVKAFPQDAGIDAEHLRQRHCLDKLDGWRVLRDTVLSEASVEGLLRG